MPSPSIFGPYVDVPAGPDAANAPVPATAADGASKRLAFSMAHPKPTEWCWAATAAAVASFYASVQGTGQALTPCQVATQCLFTACCPEPTDPADSRNREYALEGALSTTGHLAQGPVPGTLDFQSIVTEIDGDRPVCCHIAWDSANPDNGHFNAIVGYDTANQDVDISDCLYGDQTLLYTAFKNAYQGNGTWDLTYLTK